MLIDVEGLFWSFFTRCLPCVCVQQLVRVLCELGPALGPQTTYPLDPVGRVAPEMKRNSEKID